MPVVKVTRTYRLPISTVEAVRYLVERHKLAATQDAVVEMAIEDLAMAARHADEAREFAANREDHELRVEVDHLERDFAPLDVESWPD